MGRTLEEIRCEIDRENTVILEAFLRRMDLSREVAAYKKSVGRAVLDAAREREVLADIAMKTPEDRRRESRALFSRIMQISREAQVKEMAGENPYRAWLSETAEASPLLLPSYAKVACQGTEGAYSQKAAEHLFDCPQIHYEKQFEGAFAAIESGECDYAVLPIENSTAGSVNRVYDLMLQNNFYILKSYRMSIGHYLLARKGTQIGDIKRIISHEQALAQCAATLHRICPNVTLEAVSNTAAAARAVAESGEAGLASLGSRECAALYGLDILADRLHDEAGNTTRFICIAKKPAILPGADRVSLMMTLPHRAGALYEVLSIVDSYGVSLEKLESRPLPDREFEFKFYFDLRIPAVHPHLPELLLLLEGASEEFRVLGAYSELV